MQFPLFYVNRSVVRSSLLGMFSNAPWNGRDNMYVHLFINDVTPDGRDLTVDDFTLPSWVGYGHLEMSNSEDPPQIHENSTGRLGVRLNTGVDQLRWIVGADIASPVTVYGFFFYNSDLDTMLGAARFDTPYVVSKKFDYVEISSVLGYFNPYFLEL